MLAHGILSREATTAGEGIQVVGDGRRAFSARGGAQPQQRLLALARAFFKTDKIFKGDADMQNESEYLPAGGGGAINLAATAHPEPKREDPKADEMSREELLKQMHWSDDQLPIAGTCGFPSPRYQTYSRGRYEFKYSRQSVAAWIERVKSLKVR
jgi:hypothetical protein